MRFVNAFLVVCLGFWLSPGALAWAEESPGGDAADTEPPGAVLEIAYRFAGGQYNKDWSGSGTPVAIEHKGQTILDEGTDGTYCCGYTFTVVMIAAEERGLLKNKSVEQVERFQKMWYGAVGDQTPRDRRIQERQVAMAMPALKVGRAVKPADAQPGDFLQFWRTESGHSVIFLGWLKEDGQRVGVRYRSSQGSTYGIGDAEERFQNHGGKVDPRRMYFARLDAGSVEPEE
ncbi:MAG: hypothetical protein AAF333_03505 [Planctomycetota bacterium]